MYITAFIGLLSLSVACVSAQDIDITVSGGVKRKGVNFLYGDEDLMVINEVVSDGDKLNNLKSKVNLREELPPLPAEDVKCLMSVDRYCSKHMGEMKSVLIQALKEDCVKCSSQQRTSAGRIVASMMAYDPVAWKLFLTRSALQILPPKRNLKDEKPRFKIIGAPEHVRRSKSTFKLPGVKVRVKRYAMIKIN